MPELDGIRRNPKRPAPKMRKPVQPLPAREAARRRTLMWALVAGLTAVILVVWVLTIGTSLNATNGDNSAWNTLKRKVTDLKSVFRRDSGDAKIKAIDVNAPSPEEVQYLREQVFPTPQVNANTPANQNANAATENQ